MKNVPLRLRFPILNGETLMEIIYRNTHLKIITCIWYKVDILQNMFKELSFQRVIRGRTCGGDPDLNIILVIFWSLGPLTWFEKKFIFQEWNFREILLVFARIRPSIEWDHSSRLAEGESFVWSKARGVIISWPTATHLRQGQSVAKNIENLTRRLCPWKSFACHWVHPYFCYVT